jgi:MinD-like ATPase involved in chromosome partitioning or flagellar assembly
MLSDNRIRLIIGHYGSGKTEFAVNYTMKLAELGRKTCIADMDIVNPYFRSREKAEMMEDRGIRVISGARGHHANLDIPMMTAEVQAPLQDDSYDLVLDIGGDSVGARAVAQYKRYFKEGDYDMFCVINRYREQTSTLEGCIYHIKTIEATLGAKVTGLINNTHLLRDTSVEDVLYGQELVEKVSKELDIPVRYISTLEKVARELPEGLEGEIFPIQMYMRPDWL